MTAQYLLQCEENNALKRWIEMPINATDNDDEHLVAMWDIDPENLEMIAHQALHIQAKIVKSQSQQQQPQAQPNQMLNGAMSQAMSQAWSQTAKLNSNQ